MYQLFIEDLMSITGHWAPLSDYTAWFYHTVMSTGSDYHATMAIYLKCTRGF